MSDPCDPKQPVITVLRKVTPLGDRCWYYCGGRPVSMAADLAVEAASRGEIRIRTIGDAPRRPSST